MAEGPDRNLAVDFYRVSGVVLIVLGHWLAGSVTYHDGYFGRQNPLVDQPWTQWLTWPFQAVPTFFWSPAMPAQCPGPIGATRGYVAPDLAAASTRPGTGTVDGICRAGVGGCGGVWTSAGSPGSTLEYAGWAVAMHLWFLAVYLVVVSLTPIAIAAQRRWGLLVPAALAWVSRRSTLPRWPAMCPTWAG